MKGIWILNTFCPKSVHKFDTVLEVSRKNILGAERYLLAGGDYRYVMSEYCLEHNSKHFLLYVPLQNICSFSDISDERFLFVSNFILASLFL